MQAFRISDQAAGKIRVGLNLEIEFAGLRFVAEGPRNHVEQACKENLFGLYRHGPGFDLGQVQNIGNQVQQVSSGTMNGARELYLLGSQIAVGIVVQLLA